MELNIEKFDPTTAELNTLVEASKQIPCDDPLNKEQVKAAHEARMKMRTARVAITKKGKEMREEANAFTKAVIAKERELVDIISPEEQRLMAFEEAAAAAKERAERVALIPSRRAKLAEIGDEVEVSDEELMDMDGTAFVVYANKRMADHNERIRLANEETARKNREEAERLEREKQEREAEERGRQQERERAEREEQERLEREEREKREAAEREEREKERAREQKRTDRIESLQVLGLVWDMPTNSFLKDDINVSMVEITADTDQEFSAKVAKISAEIARRKEVARQEAEKAEEERKRAEQEAKEAAERAELEKEERYQAFLKEHSFTPDINFRVEAMDGQVYLYKLVGTFKPE